MMPSIGLLVLRPPISSLLQSATAFFITKCDKCCYKMRQVLQSVTILLQSATGITKRNDYYKVRQNNPAP